MKPQSTKPLGCKGCPLYHIGTGFVQPVGPANAPICVVGEAPGYEESVAGKPFVGAAGNLLDRLLTRAGLSRDEVRITNVLQCRPPGNELVGQPWEQEAINHCINRSGGLVEQVYTEKHAVYLALGATAATVLLGQPRKGFSLTYWHSYVCGSAWMDKWVIPTFHPSFLMRGMQKYTGIVLRAFLQAKEVAKNGFLRRPISLTTDPNPQEFAGWVDDHCGGPDSSWLAVDIETATTVGTAEEESLADDAAIIRINFSNNPDMGLTVPWEQRYMDGIVRLLYSPNPKVFWNARFDVPKLVKAGVKPCGPILDAMWMWHFLQSDMAGAAIKGNSLGFVAPFYSDLPPWKHMSRTAPAEYAALDALQTLRCAFGIARDLESEDRWKWFLRHVVEMDRAVLWPAEDLGLQVNLERLMAFADELAVKKTVLAEQIQKLVPVECLPLKPKEGWVKPPPADVEPVIVKTVQAMVQLCKSCGVYPVTKKHKCATGVADVTLKEMPVPRWFTLDEFNPASGDHIAKYMEFKGHSGLKGKGKKKTSKPSTDKLVLEQLAEKDPFYAHVLDLRTVDKVLSTYVNGTKDRLGDDGRVHPQFLHRPSTGRLSCVNPNLQNVVTDRSDTGNIASGFRSCLVPASGCVFVEADFAAIEAVQTGWYSNDPDYVRLAKLGVHAYLASHLVGKPADLKWSDADLSAHFKMIKKQYQEAYDRAKRVVHGTNYGLSPHGMVKNYPKLFTLSSAKSTQALYLELCPKLAAWQKQLRDRAHKQNYLGGSDHPYGYKHWFWDVYSYDHRSGKVTLGADAKRVVAFYPQSTAAGNMVEAVLRLMDPKHKWYIGRLYHGQTPIRALIHDSILCEVPKEYSEYLIEAVYNVMQRPMEEQGGLQIGVAIKIGHNWKDMSEVTVTTLASDSKVLDAEDEEA